MPKKRLPDFKTETEEADWLAKHQDDLDAYFDVLPANPVPLAERLNLPPRPRSVTKLISLRLSEEDLARAAALASKKGIGYQTLLKMLIHEALEREETSA